MPVRTEGRTGHAVMGDPRNDMMLPVPFNIPGPSVQATLDWLMLVETSLGLLVWVTLDLPVLLSLDGQYRPVSASSADQSVLVVQTSQC